MRLELNVYNINNSILNYNYNESVRKVILSYINRIDIEIAKKYHDDPHYIFNFSNIIGRSHSNKSGVYIKRGILFISSPNRDFIYTLLKSFLKFPVFSLDMDKTVKFAVLNMRILDNVNYSSPLRIRTVSPIILKRDNKYIAIDKNSSNKDVSLWIDTLKYSIRSRYKFFTGSVINDLDIELNKDDFRTKYIKIKEQRYICSDGKLKIYGDKNVIDFINDVGLGMKQKFGFGCVEAMYNGI